MAEEDAGDQGLEAAATPLLPKVHLMGELADKLPPFAESRCDVAVLEGMLLFVLFFVAIVCSEYIRRCLTLSTSCSTPPPFLTTPSELLKGSVFLAAAAAAVVVVEGVFLVVELNEFVVAGTLGMAAGRDDVVAVDVAAEGGGVEMVPWPPKPSIP